MTANKRTLSRIGIAAAIGAAVVAVLWTLPDTALSAPEEAEEKGGVVAKVAGTEITEAEVEERVSSGLLDLERKRYELMEQGLGQLVEEKLLELAAAEKGVSVDELLAAEVTGKIEAVTDEDVDAFYEARKAQIGRSKDQVASQIRQLLEQQQGREKRQALISDLRREYEVKTYLDPIRIPVTTGGAPAKGPEDAPVTIVEFSDFQCPFCSRVVPTLDQITEKYGDKVRLVFRQFPLRSIHPQAQKAAEAALCAHDQGKFWEMHDAMFEQQRKLGVDDLKAHAANLELDAEAFAECLDSGRHAAQVAADLEEGQRAGVTGTPALFVNGRFLSGAQPFDVISKVIEDELERAEQGD